MSYNEDKKVVYIVMVGKREIFYEILRRRIKYKKLGRLRERAG